MHHRQRSGEQQESSQWTADIILCEFSNINRISRHHQIILGLLGVSKMQAPLLIVPTNLNSESEFKVRAA